MTTESNSQPTGVSDNMKLTRRVYILTGMLVMVAFMAAGTVFYFNRHVKKDHEVFLGTISKLRLDLTKAHILHDELLHDGKDIDGYDNIWLLIKDAKTQLAIFTKGQQEIEWFNASFDNEEIKTRIEEIKLYLDDLKSRTEEEIKYVQTTGYDPTVLKKHDKQFRSMVTSVDHVEEKCMAAMRAEMTGFQYVQRGMVALCSVFTLVVGVIIAKYIKLQKTAELQQREFIEKLAMVNDDLESIVRISAHDLRSPLVNIQGFASELATDCKELTEIISQMEIPVEKQKVVMTALNEHIPEELNFICKSATKMDVVLEGLTRLSRLGREKLDIEPLDMNKVIFDIIDTMQYQLNSEDIEMIIEELPPCLGDETQITQLFTNLLDNAVKYIDPDRRGHIKISGKTDNGKSVYCVADNGSGISEKNRYKIFEAFSRLCPEDDSKGEGLGLSIVSRIVERNNGKVWVESQEGQGSSFYVELEMC
jgi:signal transduction histidine kinase